MRTTLQQRVEKFETWAMIAAPIFAVLLATAVGLSMIPAVTNAFWSVLDFLDIRPKWKLEYVTDIQTPIPEDYADRMPWVGGYMTMDDDTAKVLRGGVLPFAKRGGLKRHEDHVAAAGGEV